ncbi:hypothetical protein TRFO_01678 [Tritrichomonas foetus]|uniref:RRM domain-containing protein n=1 Tax=Tritrichomonas foetus TaxID=1144522 RepID=A0A1J4JV16_9EUKA|nr:hypothetical protein TRFO_01678 [Tritrichomonas foetus]|eukprot:OHT01101.1 hypothetical protein TRFO_01678 [Tritrichomonas foetus]
MSRYVRNHSPLRGGWDVGPDEYKALGFTIGLPPNIYIPQTPPIVELSQRYESIDANFIDVDSKFNVKERQFMLQTSSNARCYVRELPPNMDAEALKEALNIKLFQKKLTSSKHAISQVVINPNNEFAFVDFEKVKDAEKFIELKDSFDLEGHTLRIRRAHADETNESMSGDLPQEMNNSLIINQIPDDINEQILSTIISEHAQVEKVTIPSINEKRLGYAIVDLQDTSLVNIVMLKLRLINGFDCRRCFPRADQPPRVSLTKDKLDEMKFYNQKEENKYAVFIENSENLAISDILNLDIDITKIQTGIIPNKTCRRLRIFNVIKTEEVSEIEEVVADMREECSAFGEIEEVYADTVWEKLVRQIGTPVVVIFKTVNDANNAQRGISGRKYKGRVVITMLEDD